MKDKCLVYGNCQAMAIATLLAKHAEFSKKYELVDIQPVHLIGPEDISDLEEQIRSVGLFIYQPVAENYRGLSQLSTDSLATKLRPSAQKISFPVAYFTGYHPEITYLKGTPNTVINEPFPYHDLNILKLYAQGKSASDTVEAIASEDFYDVAFARNNVRKTLNQLSAREQTLDIQLSPFISDNFQRLKLFHTFNHPTHWTIEFIIESILVEVEMGSDKKPHESIRNLDVLSRSSFPIYPSLVKALRLNFSLSTDYKIENSFYKRREVVKHFFDFYEKNSDHVSDYLKYTPMRT